MSNSEESILNISQTERGRKERLLTEIAQNYLGERGFKAIPQFTIHRTFEYRIHPGNELREAIEKDVFFNENLVSGGVWNTEISYRNGYEHRLDVLGIGYGMELCGIEIKSCWDDFRTDKKWPSYMDFLNRMYILADEPTAVKIAAYLKDHNQCVKDGLCRWCDFILHCRPQSRRSTPAPANPICAGVIAAMDDGTTKIIKKAMRLSADGKTTELVNAIARGLTYPGQFCYVDYSPDRSYRYGEQIWQ